MSDASVRCSQPAALRRTIIHADLDAFYASVEQLDNPDLRGKPVVVGGSPDSRGVVAAASYEARAFGIRSAMPMSRAVRLCPDLVQVYPRFDRYGVLSRVVMGIFRTLTPLVEPLSLDEAFLDVTERIASDEQWEPLARRLKRDVKHATGLVVSIGMASNKSVAKIASDMGKPDGLLLVPRGEEADFLAPLPIRALWGIGPKTERAILQAGIRTIGDLAARSTGDAERLLGSRGPFMLAMARGIDDRGLETDYERKSVGAENTFARDLPDGEELRAELWQIAETVGARLEHHGSRAGTIAIKLRYADFKTITRQSSIASPTNNPATIAAVALDLLHRAANEGDRFRLLGIQCSKLTEGIQGGLWPDASEAPTS